MNLKHIDSLDDLVQDGKTALEILWEHDQISQRINFPEDQPNRKLFETNMRESYKSDSEGFFFAVEDNKIIGSLLLRVKYNPYRKQRFGEVWYIYLDESCRGKGLGPKLLGLADEFFRSKACSYSFAGVSALNPMSNAAFKKSGYKHTRTIYEKPL